jgi:hypothetical protein
MHYIFGKNISEKYFFKGQFSLCSSLMLEQVFAFGRGAGGLVEETGAQVLLRRAGFRHARQARQLKPTEQ